MFILLKREAKYMTKFLSNAVPVNALVCTLEIDTVCYIAYTREKDTMRHRS